MSKLVMNIVVLQLYHVYHGNPFLVQVLVFLQ